jgi:hypothetical protein
MSGSVDLVRRITAVMILGLLVVPLIASSSSLQVDDLNDYSDEIKWWENTNMDEDKDRIHDATRGTTNNPRIITAVILLTKSTLPLILSNVAIIS